MNLETSQPILLAATLPAFATELRQLLIEQGEPELAVQVVGLQIFDRCRCEDSFCATFYTHPRPKGSFGSNHWNLALTPNEGMLILDVVDGRIVCVEVLYCNEVREKVRAAIP